MRKTSGALLTIFLTIGFVLATGMVAKADLMSFTLVSPFQTTISGQDVAFQAVLQNTSQGTIYLDGDNFSSSLVIDDSPFWNIVPISLDIGQGYNGLLFSVGVPNGITPGLYTGSFGILVGDGSGSPDLLESVDFNVNVNAPVSVPEPGLLALLGTGLVGLCGVVRWRWLG